MHLPLPSESRRGFLQKLVVGSAGVWASAHAATILAQSNSSGLEASGRKLGVALMGLGGYSTGELGPALKVTQLCRLAGVITGSRSKGERWSREYGFPQTSIYSYDTIGQIAENKEIDIIYVVTPPGRHRDHVVAAAATGKHVICEKPMANSVAECDAMIDACRKSNVKLSVGYRLAFDPFHQELDRLAREKTFGEFRTMTGAHSFTMGRRVWRVEKALAGGGPLMDVGVYIIQAACRAAAAGPVAVTATEPPKTNPTLFNEVEETIQFTMEYPNGAKCSATTSYADNGNSFRAEAPGGWYELGPAYSYRGLRGATSEARLNFKPVPQQARHMDNFAQCILRGTDSPVPGEMGRAHMAIIEAIYEAARTGKRTPVQGAEWLNRTAVPV